ncbi:XrtA/PEP-CTERM system TPR-repeat protein PrsT [Thalassotalea euphylliae]|uniref:PEP-CTERM system TPR-repeat protein PrsT n=1 Tax=Thalassotalea euphylliae TaxID=1655234 RepID=A0A3E0U5L9_9GAMM|nr:XrtA/PEP-CTERM system TPR-repeat protein PrsT [Thalassotalea euphylliae]REL31475.1 PEP-CTERM system TPR-repeat protein PrsT [Thalassotalea euphylliae]
MNKRTIIALAVAGVLAAGCSEQENAASYLEQAKAAKQNLQPSNAIIALKNAIKLEPNNGEARFLLGQLYLSQGNAINATKELERAQKAKFDASLVSPLIARSYYLVEDFEAVSALPQSSLTPDALLTTHFYKLLTFIRQGNLEQATSVLQEMQQANEAHGYTALANAFIHYEQQNLAQAEQEALGALSKVPGQPEAILLLGNIAAASENYVLASENFLKYLELQPHQRVVELLVANAFLKAEKFEQAEKYADRMLKGLPNQPLANYVKAMVRVQDQDYELALHHAEKAINNNLNQANLRLVAGVSAFYLNKYEQVMLYIKPLVKYLPEDHFARKMLVVSQVELGIIEDVAATLGSVDENAVTGADFYSALSFKLLQAGAQQEAKAIIEAVNIDENSPQQLLKDGMLKLMVNDEKALASLERAVELDPELVKAELAIAYMALNADDFAKAESIANKWQKAYPDKPDGLNLSAAVALKQGKSKVGKALLEQAMSVEPNVYALLQLAQLSLIEQNQVKALELLQQAKSIAPDNIRVLRALLQLDETDKTLNEIKTKINQSADNTNLILVYAEALFRKEQVEDALTQLNTITPNIQTPKFFWQLKVTGYRYSQNSSLVKTTLNEWRKVNPYHLEPYIYLAEVYVLEKDFDGALRTIESGLIKQPESLPLKLIKAEVLINARKAREARDLLAELEEDIANRQIRHGLYGRLALLERDFTNAESHLSQFYKIQPNARNALLLAGALSGAKQKPQAIAILKSHLAEHAYDSRVGSLLGSLMLESGLPTDALSVYQQMADKEPGNVIALNNTAWLFMEQGQLEQALNYAEKAVAIAPEVASVIDTYAQVLLRLGDSDEALANSSLAYKNSKGKDVDIKLNYIEALIINERIARAIQLLEETNVETAEQSQKKSRIESMIK